MENVNFTTAAKRLRAAGLRVSRDPDGEIRVGFPGNESAAYYTDCPADALATGLDMVERAKAGATVSADPEGDAIERGEHTPGEPWDGPAAYAADPEPVRYVPTSAEAAFIREKAKAESRRYTGRADVKLEPGIRFNLETGKQADSVNVLEATAAESHGDSDLADHATWADFRDGFNMVRGRAVVDFYVYNGDGLACNVLAYFDADGLAEIRCGSGIESLWRRAGFTYRGADFYAEQWADGEPVDPEAEPWDPEREAIETGAACVDCGAEIDRERLFPLCDSCGDPEPVREPVRAVSPYADVSALQPGDSVPLLISTMGKAWERKPLVFHRLPDRDGAPVFRVTSPGGTLDSGPLPGGTLEPVAHRTLQGWIKATAGAWAWRIETRRAALLREYAGERRKAAGRARSAVRMAWGPVTPGGPSVYHATGERGTAREALERARETLETGGRSANPYGPESAIWSGRGGSGGRVFSAYGESRCRWVENPESVGLRFLGLAHDAAPAGHAYMRAAVEHRGWYLDEYGGETVAGVVYMLPGRDGRARYLFGYADPWNSDRAGRGPALLSLDILEGEPRDSDWDPDPALREAAQRADGMAERMAEDTREYDSGWQAGRAAREAAAEALEAAREWTAAIRDLRALLARRRGLRDVMGAERAGALIRREIKAARRDCETFREARDAARRLRADSPCGRWSPGGPDNAARGWCDGYAEGV